MTFFSRSFTLIFLIVETLAPCFYSVTDLQYFILALVYPQSDPMKLLVKQTVLFGMSVILLQTCTYRVRRNKFLGWSFHLMLIRLARVSVIKFIIISDIIQEVRIHTQGGLWEFSGGCNLFPGGLCVLQRILACGLRDQLLFI